jgi:hypothetical protein
VSESLSRLERDQLQKFAQYLIAKLPEKILPVAQKILDDLLKEADSDINTLPGGPDPTLGGAVGEQVAFCLDAKNLKENIQKILVKFCVPAPIVFSDVNYLSTSAPPSASEWCSFLRPLRGREPEGMWNLLSIVREMYRRNDRNGIPLLEIVTQQCLAQTQIMVWWFNTRVALQQKHGYGHHASKHNVNSSAHASQYACASLCDEIVVLWKLAALNPCIAPAERETLRKRLLDFHVTAVEKVLANPGGSGGGGGGGGNGGGRGGGGGGSHATKSGRPSDLELFSGFKPAIEACSLDWRDYPIAGVTYGHNSHYLSPFAVFRLRQDETPNQQSQVTSSEMVLRGEYPATGPHNPAAAGQMSQLAQQPLARPQRQSKEEVVSDEGVEKDQPPSLEANQLDALSPDSGADEPPVGGEAAAAIAAAAAGPPLASQKSSDSAASGASAVAVAAGESDAEPAGAQAQAEDPDDQYRIYFYDSKLPLNARNGGDGVSRAGQPLVSPLSSLDLFRNLRRTVDDPWETLFMRAEGLHAHGYHAEACSLAVRLAHHLLKNPPDLAVPSLYGGGHRSMSGVGTSSSEATTIKTEGGANDANAPPTAALGAISKVRFPFAPDFLLISCLLYTVHILIDNFLPLGRLERQRTSQKVGEGRQPRCYSRGLFHPISLCLPMYCAGRRSHSSSPGLSNRPFRSRNGAAAGLDEAHGG